MEEIVLSDDFDYSAEFLEIPGSFKISETGPAYLSGGPRDLVAWRNAMELVKKIYVITKSWPNDERYGLTSQIRRSAVSVPANIAEGHGRAGVREFLNHLSMAMGSLREVETLLEVAWGADYISEEVFAELMTQCDQTRRPLRGLYGYLKGKL